MAATAFQVSEQVYFLGKSGPRKAAIVSTVTNITDDQEDKYYVENETAAFLESQIHATKADLITYVTGLINALD